MMAKRTRIRAPKHKPPPAAPRSSRAQDDVEHQAAELLALWRIMPHALARDSAGVLTGDRHSTGGSKGSAASANLDVIEATVIIETGLAKIAAEAIPILNLDPGPRPTFGVISALPDWHRALEARNQPLAKHIASDLRRWLREAQGAVGVRKRDRPLGSMCPDHRDNPAPLLEVGAQATLAATLVAGPPHGARVMIGPTCRAPIAPAPREDGIEIPTPEPCEHSSCQLIRERRLIEPGGRRADWVLTPSDVVWKPRRGDTAYTWRETSEIRCPACKRTWTEPEEKLLLARELKELGDARPNDRTAEAMVTR